MEDVGIFYGHMIYFTTIWYIYLVAISFHSWLLGIFFPFWFVVPRKNLATLCSTKIRR
jgi:hypothetical protein